MPVIAKKGEPEKKKKELPQELCGCGVDTYRPPPKGKKAQAPVVHEPSCVYQRTTCEAYPNFTKCTVCQNPCKWCLGKNRWCPHCYETQCTNRYKRVVHGWEMKAAEADTTQQSASVVERKSLAGKATASKRSKSVTFVDK